jgi:polysaccharide biosynthesis protein PslG
MSRWPNLTRQRPYLTRMSVAFTGLGFAVVLTGASLPASTHQNNSAANANAARPPAAPGLTFGISDPALAGETSTAQVTDITGMKAAGITSIRIEANWSWVQPTGPNAFDWSIVDQEVSEITGAGLTVDLVIDGCPPWAAVAGAANDPSPQPKSSAQYAAFAADVAARYAPDGVRYFEIWNEENAADFWQPKPNPAAYTADLVAAYKSIKKVDSSAFVISGGLAPEATDGTNYNGVDFLKAMYKDGAKGSFDALGYHAYSYPALPNTYESWSAWSQMSQTNPSIRSVMTANGDSAKKLWITEFGAPSSGPEGIGTTAQATTMTQGIADSKSTSWIGSLYIYTWQDDPAADAADVGFGLLDQSGLPKPAYTAVTTALHS